MNSDIVFYVESEEKWLIFSVKGERFIVEYDGEIIANFVINNYDEFMLRKAEIEDEYCFKEGGLDVALWKVIGGYRLRFLISLEKTEANYTKLFTGF